MIRQNHGSLVDLHEFALKHMIDSLIIGNVPVPLGLTFQQLTVRDTVDLFKWVFHCFI